MQGIQWGLFLAWLGMGFSRVGISAGISKENPCAKLALRMGSVVVSSHPNIRVGTLLGAGTSIRTGKDSFAKLILADNSIVDIGSETLFKLSKCESLSDRLEINLELELGGIRANVVPSAKARKFRVRTPTSLLGVRGTEFFVSWAKDSLGQIFERISVSRGEVIVSKLFEPRANPVFLRTGTELRQAGKEAGFVESQVDQFNATEQRRFEEKTKPEPSDAIEALKLDRTDGPEKNERPDSQASRNEPNRRNPDPQEKAQLQAAQLLNSTMLGDEPTPGPKEKESTDSGPVGRVPASVSSDKGEEGSGTAVDREEGSGAGAGEGGGGKGNSSSANMGKVELGGGVPGSPRNNPIPGGSPVGANIPILKNVQIQWSVKNGSQN